MRGPNFATGWALPRCARTAVPPICPSGGAPFLAPSGVCAAVYYIHDIYVPYTRNGGSQYAKSPGTCAAACGPLWRAILRPENRFCSPKYHFRHLKLILDHTSHFRLLYMFHDGGRFPDDCSTEAGSHRLKSVWGLRNSFLRS